MSVSTNQNDFTFYFGAASASARKALRRLSEPQVMINYATQLNEPWFGIDNLFIDSGGYSFMMGKGEYTTSDEEYANWLLDVDPHIFALRDYPCEPDVLREYNRSVADHQKMTTERHCDLWNLVDAIDGQRVSVIQGWDLNQYLEHLDMLRDQDVLADYAAIGSVCGRENDDRIREIILGIRDELNDDIDLHAFGIKGSVLQYPAVRDALSSADSQSFGVQARWGTLREIESGDRTWRDTAYEYLRQRRRIMSILAGNDDKEPTDNKQQTLKALEEPAD